MDDRLLEYERMNVNIVLARAPQLELAARIHSRVFSVIGQNQRDAIKLLRAPDQRVAVAIAKKGGELLGYTQASKRGSSCYLSWIAVSKEARNKGVGSALLRDLKLWAKQNGCTEIALDSRNRFREALFFYLKNDFDIVGTYRGPDDDTMIRLRLKVGK